MSLQKEAKAEQETKTKAKAGAESMIIFLTKNPEP